MPRASDLVQDSKLDTNFVGHNTHHVSYRSIASTQQRNIRVDELWSRQGKIGDGTHGRVWLESCFEGPRTGELRAVKEIPKALASNAETDFTRELEAIAKFSQVKYVHCFVRSFGWYEDENSVFIAMEYMKHGDLQKRLNQSYLEIEVQSIASQLLEGLQFMHENGFTHRDLKPSNILVLYPFPRWWVKIGDFGISKRVEEGLTSLRTIVGTRGYLAPELNKMFPETDSPTKRDAQKSYTSAVDMWALGEICFRLIAKVPAFPTTGDLFKYVARGQDFPYALLQDVNASHDCISFIRRMMAASAADRPSASDALMCAWISSEETAELNRQSRTQEWQADAVGLRESQNFEPTAEWSTLSGPLTMSTMSSAPGTHARESILFPEDLQQTESELSVSSGAIQRNELNKLSSSNSIAVSGNASPIVRPLQSMLENYGSASPEYSLDRIPANGFHTNEKSFNKFYTPYRESVGLNGTGLHTHSTPTLELVSRLSNQYNKHNPTDLNGLSSPSSPILWSEGRPMGIVVVDSLNRDEQERRENDEPDFLRGIFNQSELQEQNRQNWRRVSVIVPDSPQQPVGGPSRTPMAWL